VADNNATGRQVLADLLESFAFNVSAVDSGEKAILTLRQSAAAGSPFQLVVLDWKLPGMDAIKAATAVRNDPNLQGAPVIILSTGYDYKTVQAHLDMAAVGACLLKPVNPSQLFSTVMELFCRTGAIAPRIKAKRAEPPGLMAGRRVLVVEDSELNRVVAVALLKEQGLSVEIATNGRMAVDMMTAAETGYYDAVLMDIQMPVMHGYEATKKIRELEKERAAICGRLENRIPIIALTAHAVKGEKEKCLAADMDDYLAKPIDEKQLERVLRKWIC
jgi:two-component system sensor histidine kinase/response regulator